jgi:hypothetical protein
MGTKGTMDFVQLCLKTDDELADIFARGTMPSFEELVGYEFDGYNTMDLTQVIGIRRFRKGFLAADETVGPNEIGGYNVTVRPGPPTTYWDVVYKKGKPHRHSPYRVYEVPPGDKEEKYPNALLINYECKRNPAWNPGFLRDYLVKVDPGNPDLFLGKAYVALGSARIYVSYFVLRRAEKVDPATVWS